MFNEDFYPTPPEVIEKVLFGLDLKDKIVLEPSAGKGDLLIALKKAGAKTIACEINADLSEITKSKCDVFLKNDFLEVSSTEISHVNYIIANPPFSCADKHILHMWEIAPSGCEIVALCNSNTLENRYTRFRDSLESIVRNYGTKEYLGKCFEDSERKTDVEVSLIRLYKPREENDTEFDGYFDLSEEYENTENGIIQYSELRDIVNRYVGSCKLFNSVSKTETEINSLISPINKPGNCLTFGCFEYLSGRNTLINRDEFKKKLQKSAWLTIFDKMEMEKYVTKSVLENINKFVEQQVNVPFTLNNIHKMVSLIIGTHGDRMSKVIVEVFDSITKHYHDNRYNVEGWKTNDCFMVNKKFILPNIISINFKGAMIANWNNYWNTIDELTKALCYLTGTKYETIGRFDDFMHYDYVQGEDMKLNKINVNRNFGEWYEFGFFRIKGYRKGTAHIEFKDTKVWEMFNLAAVKAKGWTLPETFKHSYRQKTTGVEIYG